MSGLCSRHKGLGPGCDTCRPDLIEGLGYDMADIETLLGPERYKVFERWISGQTMAMSSEERTLVDPWDYRAFLRGEAVSD